MVPITVDSYQELKQKLNDQSRSYLLLYKKGSGLSDEAFDKLQAAAREVEEVNILTADLNHVRDIHPEFNITSAPVLLEFDKHHFKNIYKGVHSASFYTGLFKDSLFVAQAEKSGRPMRRVTVYSTPTCSWCNTLKAYLRTHHIRFTDVDVSRDAAKAQEMARRSGQQGVPQTDIDGRIIVGFDKQKINELLAIEEHVN